MIIYNLEQHLPREAGVGSLFTCLFRKTIPKKSNKIEIAPIQEEKVTLLPGAENPPPPPIVVKKRAGRKKRKKSPIIEKNKVNIDNNKRGKKRAKIPLIEDDLDK